MTGRRERIVKLTLTTKTVRGRRYRESYVKVRVPLYLVEKLGIVAYRVHLDEETGRITLEPVYGGTGSGEVDPAAARAERRQVEGEVLRGPSPCHPATR